MLLILPDISLPHLTSTRDTVSLCANIGQCLHTHTTVAAFLHTLLYHIVVVIHSTLIYVRSKKERGMRYKPDAHSHRVTQDCIMRDGLKKGVCYKQDVCLSLRE